MEAQFWLVLFNTHSEALSLRSQLCLPQDMALPSVSTEHPFWCSHQCPQPGKGPRALQVSRGWSNGAVCQLGSKNAEGWRRAPFGAVLEKAVRATWNMPCSTSAGASSLSSLHTGLQCKFCFPRKKFSAGSVWVYWIHWCFSPQVFPWAINNCITLATRIVLWNHSLTFSLRHHLKVNTWRIVIYAWNTLVH